VTNLDIGSVLLENKFLYDSWNLIAELNATNNAVIRSYMWGIDLSGSIQGAGGVGGLLAVNDSANGVHFAAYDGNGNVVAMVKATDGTISAQYEYGPFSEPIRVTGPMGKTNPIRFSSKYTDDESDFLNYGHRYYSPSTGRWLNRDPIDERGGLNLYVMLRGDLINQIDPTGLEAFGVSGKIVIQTRDKRKEIGYVINFNVDKDGKTSINSIGLENAWGPFDVEILEVKVKGTVSGRAKCKWPLNVNFGGNVRVDLTKKFGKDTWQVNKEETVSTKGDAGVKVLCCCISGEWDLNFNVLTEWQTIKPRGDPKTGPTITINPDAPASNPCKNF
jgi:RHS repeat-associated protein